MANIHSDLKEKANNTTEKLARDIDWLPKKLEKVLKCYYEKFSILPTIREMSHIGYHFLSNILAKVQI